MRDRFLRLVTMKETVDESFENVFVNVEDENVRRNRLALCARTIGVKDAFNISLATDLTMGVT